MKLVNRNPYAVLVKVKGVEYNLPPGGRMEVKASRKDIEEAAGVLVLGEASDVPVRTDKKPRRTEKSEG